MKKILLATTLIFTAGMASAFELGSTGVFVDNTTSVDYSVEAGELTASHEIDVNYFLANDVKIYALTEVDLSDPEFTGLKTGAEYVAYAQGSNEVTVGAYVRWDEDLAYSDTVATLELKF